MPAKTSSPAYNRERIQGDNNLLEMPWCGKIILRGDPTNSRILRKASSVLGADLPLEANTLAQGSDRTVFWMGPNEWLIHCTMEEAGDLLAKLRDALDGIHHAAVDVSDYYTVLELSGPDAAALLSRGCPMDLHATEFVPGSCAQTRFGHASILLHRTGETEFRIQVRWSYTEYVWDYIASAVAGLTAPAE